MELKKCKNCGAFITSDQEYCTTCVNMLSYNKTILKGYFDNVVPDGNIGSIASTTGVSPSLVQNFMVENNYIDSDVLTKTSFASLPY